MRVQPLALLALLLALSSVNHAQAEPAAAPRLVLEASAALHGPGGVRLKAVLRNAGGGVLTLFVPERFGDNDFPGWRLVREDGAAFAPYQPPYQSMWTEGDQGSLVRLAAGEAWQVEHEVAEFLVTRAVGGTAAGPAADLTPVPLPAGRYRVEAWHVHERAEIPVGKPMFETTTRAVAGLWTGKVEAPPTTIEMPRASVVSLAIQAPREHAPGAHYVLEVVVRNDTADEARLVGRLTLVASSKPHGSFRAEVPWPAEAPAAPRPDRGAQEEGPATCTLAPGGERRFQVDLAGLRFRGGRSTPEVERSLADALGQGIFHLEASVALDPAGPALTSNGLWRYVAASR